MSPEAVDAARKALEAARDAAELDERDARHQAGRAEALWTRADGILGAAVQHRDATLEALAWFDQEFPEPDEDEDFTVPTDATDPEDPAWTEVSA